MVRKRSLVIQLLQYFLNGQICCTIYITITGSVYLPAHGHTGFYPSFSTTSPTCLLSLTDTKERSMWSSPFLANKPGICTIKIFEQSGEIIDGSHKQNDGGRGNFGLSNHSFIRVTVAYSRSSVHVHFSEEDIEAIPFRFLNKSTIPVGIGQSLIGQNGPSLKVQPYESCYYAWDDCTQPSLVSFQTLRGWLNDSLISTFLLSHMEHRFQS